MKKLKWIFLIIAFSTTSVMAEISKDQVIAAIQKEGIKIKHIKQHARDPSALLPNSFKERWSFEDIDLNNGKGGQFFICTKMQYCESIYKYYEALVSLAGPYLYHNSDGTLVVQLNSGLSPEQAERYEKVFTSL